MMNSLRCISVALVLSIQSLYAQEDLLTELEQTEQPARENVTATFKGTRLVNLHTVETLAKGSLDFRISHRFGDFSSGAYNFYGLDGPASIRLGFDYSVSNPLTVGIGRSSLGKLVDGFIKYRILRQTSDDHMPIGITGVVSGNITAEKDVTRSVTGIDRYHFFPSRISYFYQLIIARKFNSNLSLQISPMLVHYNLVVNTNDKNDILAVGFAGRYKVSKRIAVTGEYVLRSSYYTALTNVYHNSASIGVDIETGGHVFQLFLTNSVGMNEVQVIPYTASGWNKGQIRIGFNISRVFSLGGKKSGRW